MINYWSCSKFIGKLRVRLGFPTPLKSGTSEEWRDYHANCKAYNQFLDWLTDDAVDALQRFIYSPKTALDSFAYWVYNRFIVPSHMINTRLEKGKWHETDEKIMHGMFEELVDFVEIQKTNMQSWQKDPEIQKFVPWHDKYMPYCIHRFFETRSQHLGVNYLLWETSLVKDDDYLGVWDDMSEDEKLAIRTREDYGKPTQQAEGALEILDLYCWWKFIRPNRPDPFVESGLADYYDRNPIKDIWDTMSKPTPDEWKDLHEKDQELERMYEREDEEMMIRLIKIRKHLWT